MTSLQTLRADTMHLRGDDTVLINNEQVPVWKIRALSQPRLVERAAEFPSPAIYDAPLAAMRSASASEPRTAEETFEDGWKAQRARELSAQRDRMAANLDAHPPKPRLTAAELKTYAPLDPYAAALKKETR